MHYTEFRARVYAILDLYEELSNDPYVDSPRINLEDTIDQLMIDVLKGKDDE